MELRHMRIPVELSLRSFFENSIYGIENAYADVPGITYLTLGLVNIVNP